MPAYKAPVEDALFLLNDVFHIERLANLPGFADASPDVLRAMFDTAARFCEEVLTPLISPSRGLLSRLSSASEVLGPRVGLADDMVSAIETRALWARYGL